MTSTTFVEYQAQTADTAIYPGAGDQDSVIGLAYVALGLSGEAGEINNKVKKVLRDKSGIIDDDFRIILAEELGDTLWYAAQLATQLGVDMSLVARNNLSKLADRKSRGVLQGSGDNR